MFMYKKSFDIGINYWPAKKAMYWWQHYDLTEVKQDFARLAAFRFHTVRIFLTWEDFQPHPDVISARALQNLVLTADCAEKFSLKLVPTFFCGHMSGVNWLPYWMVNMDANSSRRFPIFCQNSIQKGQVKNFYADQELMLAQVEQVSKVSRSLQGHPAIHSYDLGNEASNVTIPHNREQACHWLAAMVDAIKKYTDIPITLGMHAEDLEEDRHLWPQDAGKFCDYLCMHAYPFYLSWIKNPLDYRLVPFLSIITAWLGQKPVVMQEFGLPTLPSAPAADENQEKQKYQLFQEETAAQYEAQVLAALYAHQFPAALAWCYSDYAPSLWTLPPLDQNIHERYFGLFHYDGSPKKNLTAFKEVNWKKYTSGSKYDLGWLQNYSPDRYYDQPLDHLTAMFSLYQKSLPVGGIS